MATLFAQGDAVTADKLNGAWASYAVSWTASGSAPSLGNGALLGWWTRIGNMMGVQITLTIGSTTTTGTGFWSFSLPVAGNGVGSQPFQIGQAWAVEQGVDFFIGGVDLNTSTTVVIQGVPGATTWGAVTPFTWFSTCVMELGCWIPVA